MRDLQESEPTHKAAAAVGTTGLVGIRNGTLTGRTRGRIGWFGKVIMQVEQYIIKSEYREPNPPKMAEVTNEDFEAGHWRDARPDDFIKSNSMMPTTEK